MEREANPDEYEEDEHGQCLNGLGMMLSAMIANISRALTRSFVWFTKSTKKNDKKPPKIPTLVFSSNSTASGTLSVRFAYTRIEAYIEMVIHTNKSVEISLKQVPLQNRRTLHHGSSDYVGEVKNR